MIYEVKHTTKFTKDLKRIQKRGYDVSLLTEVIKKLAIGEVLPLKNKDHPLTGNFGYLRECHIAPDWLLIYEKSEETLVLYLTRTGTHSDLFN
ncbi:MAG: type II toxin-antitoxin system YafQ family toxin [Lachnospiraceae bacterium]